MAGKKGRSGPVAGEIRLWCEGQARVYALPKIARYLQQPRKGPTDPAWRWCFEQLARLGQLEVLKVEHGATDELTAALDAAREAFQSRIDGVAARLGSAAMPEWPERT